MYSPLSNPIIQARPPEQAKMVGVEGIEPSTFCSQSRRAKPLRYTPAT